MKKSNKGFSLVELIIVIAIMAILIAVLAPQYLKYVEKTKKNTDAKAFGEVVQAVEVAIADPILNPTSGNVSVSWNGSAFTVSGTNASNIQTEVNEVITGNSGSAALVAKSKAFSNGGGSSVSFTINSTTGNWSKTSSGLFESYVDY
jgi:type IV pilus assembly protein PilA